MDNYIYWEQFPSSPLPCSATEESLKNEEMPQRKASAGNEENQRAEVISKAPPESHR